MSRSVSLNAHKPANDARCVLYVMSRDQRLMDNHALLEAQKAALENELPLVIVFNLWLKVGVRSREHYTFMLDGLEQLANTAKKYNITFILTTQSSFKHLTDFCNSFSARSIFFDFNPLHGPRRLAKYIATHSSSPCVVIDTHNIIPAWLASDKREYAAHTFRRKVHTQLEDWLIEPKKLTKHPHACTLKINSLSFSDAKKKIQKIAKSGIHVSFDAGEKAAHSQLRSFIQSGLKSYAAERNNIATDQQSGLSPYLHFGHIASLRVALEVLYKANHRPLLFDQARMNSDTASTFSAGMNTLFEEMIVRKELSDNFCFYSKSYTSLSAAEPWAQKTLQEHTSDQREPVYTSRQLEFAQTHDEAWNAAQKELTTTGKIHGYMRMYWAKKVLEWTKSPEDALKQLLYLNDHYHIDGGDPNGYVGILWSVAGVHDRPWTEREIFGKIRYMNESGLKRKFDVAAYIKRVNNG